MTQILERIINVLEKAHIVTVEDWEEQEAQEQ